MMHAYLKIVTWAKAKDLSTLTKKSQHHLSLNYNTPGNLMSTGRKYHWLSSSRSKDRFNTLSSLGLTNAWFVLGIETAPFYHSYNCLSRRFKLLWRCYGNVEQPHLPLVYTCEITNVLKIGLKCVKQHPPKLLTNYTSIKINFSTAQLLNKT